MRFVCFYHSLVSDWNHGNAHFLRGVMSELVARGHQVVVYEPEDSWSRRNLLADQGPGALAAFHATYPGLESRRYELETLALQPLLADADVVIVHEWSSPVLVERLGRARRRGNFALLFHDTHHRMVTAPDEMQQYDLSGYDGVLAFGEVLRRLYRERRLCERAFTWHEAADTRVFYPRAEAHEADLVWVGNWGDGERSAELEEFLLEPCRQLRLSARVHGVRYPEPALVALREANVSYRGFVANFHVPDLFARHTMTVHVPRRPYVRALRGVPTIRMFEALACGIPLVSAPWDDVEQLFRPGTDFLVASDGAQMAQRLRALREDAGLRESVRTHGLETIRARHTCVQRVDELLEILRRLGQSQALSHGPRSHSTDVTEAS